MPLRLLITLALITGCAAQPEPERERTPEEIARELLVVDTHIDLPHRLLKDFEDVTTATERGDFDYPRARYGGLDAAFMSIYVPAAVDQSGEGMTRANHLIDYVERIVEHAPNQFAIATCADDITAAKAQGLIALPMGLENGGPIGDDMDNLWALFERGIRYVTLTHGKVNDWSDSSYDENERWGGLSQVGETAVRELNRIGVMVDVSHVSDQAFWRVMEISAVPVIASHSSLRHFTPGFHRNMSDEMVRALADNGGVVQINFGSAFLTEEANDYGKRLSAAARAHKEAHGLADDDPAWGAFRESYREANPYPFANVSHVLDHIDRTVEIAGIDAVGIGSDFDGVGDTLPEGLKDASGFPNLVAGLRDRGYSLEEMAKILGGNLMRVWRTAEDHAAVNGITPRCRL